MYKEINVHNNYDAIHHHLPVARKELECEDLDILCVQELPGKLWKSLYNNMRSKRIKILPLVSGLYPLRPYDRNHHYPLSGATCSGLYEIEGVRYILLKTGNCFTEQFVILRQGDRKKFLSVCRKNRTKPERSPIDKPVLADGIVDDVYKNSVEFYKVTEKMHLRSGIVLSGPPGNGKSMLTRWIMNEARKKNIHWSVISATALMDSFNSDNLHEIFDFKGIVIFDDIDISFFDRSSSSGKLACAMLSAMDGLTHKNTSVRIFTTNEDVSSMDPAFMRPGRISRVYVIDKPTETAKKAIIDSWDNDILEVIDTERLLGLVGDCSGAELVSVRNFIKIEQFMGNALPDLQEIVDVCTNQNLKRQCVGFV